MEDPDEAGLGSGYPATPGRAAGARDMLQAAADLVNPWAAARELPWLAGELLKIAIGRSDLAFEDSDPRFRDAAWRDNPAFRGLGLSYRLFEQWTDRMAGAVDGPWERQARARYLANIVTGALSPTNYLITNPLALKRAFETGGRSVLRGGRNMLRDLARGGMPSMGNRKPFPVGEKLACTPGSVVYREDIFELLQYAPATRPSGARRC